MGRLWVSLLRMGIRPRISSRFRLLRSFQPRLRGRRRSVRASSSRMRRSVVFLTKALKSSSGRLWVAARAVMAVVIFCCLKRW